MFRRKVEIFREIISRRSNQSLKRSSRSNGKHPKLTQKTAPKQNPTADPTDHPVNEPKEEQVDEQVGQFFRDPMEHVCSTRDNDSPNHADDDRKNDTNLGPNPVYNPKDNPENESNSDLKENQAEIVSAYQYQALDRERKEIRILVIEPSLLLHAPMIVRMETLYLTDPVTPIYNALSYVWGKPDKTETIEVNGKPFAVTEQLLNALKRMREPAEELMLWVDAICIDQNDNKDKEAQLPLMGLIYTLAHYVLCWFGEPTKEEEELILAVEALVAYLIPFTVSRYVGARWEVRPSSMRVYKKLMIKAYQGIVFLYSNTYWTRVWIAQEFSLATKYPGMFYGKHLIHPWTFDVHIAKICNKKGASTIVQKDIVDLSEIAGTDEWVLPRWEAANQPYNRLRELYRIRRERAIEPSISLILFWLKLSKATNPYDAVFGIYGLIGEQTLTAPSYERKLPEVYWEVLCRALERDGRGFYWPVFEGYRLLASDGEDTQYPSWILDLNYGWENCEYHQLLMKLFNKPQWELETKHAPKLTCNNRHLSIYGVELGRVRHVLYVEESCSCEEIYDKIRRFAVEEIMGDDIAFITESIEKLQEGLRASPQQVPWCSLMVIQALQDFQAYFEEDSEPIPFRVHDSWQAVVRNEEFKNTCFELVGEVEKMKGKFGRETIVSQMVRLQLLEGPFSLFSTGPLQIGEALEKVSVGDSVTFFPRMEHPWILRPGQENSEAMFRMVSQARVEYFPEGEVEREVTIC